MTKVIRIKSEELSPSNLNMISKVRVFCRSSSYAFLLRKEVIHPHVPVGIPCYDLTPIINPTLNGSLLTVRPPALGIVNFRGLTGGVYKPRERIHRNMLICDY